MALELLAGTGFKMLYDGVKQAVRTRGKLKTLLKGLESTLDSLQEKVIQQIGEHNVELGLPNEEIERLQMEMKDGAKLVAQLAKLPRWNICGSWDAYRQQIDDLDRALKGLLRKLNLQALRDMKELLALSRDNRDNLYRLNRSLLNIQTAVRARAGYRKEAECLDLLDSLAFIDLAGGQVESTNLSKQERFDGVVGFESVDGWNPFKVKETVGYHDPFLDWPSSSGVKETCGRAGDNQMLAHISTVAMKGMRPVKFVTSGYFSQLQEVGEGSFGTVYKALLDGGQVVSIKRAEKVLFEHLQPDSEFELLSKIDHCNLAKLLSYFDEGNERLIITEYVANGTLREHLDVKYGKILEFNQRLEIAIDVAHGLTYLHLYPGRQIIHRDVNSSSILLTENMRAKVADFGFSTKAKGTIGYTDPEYGETGQLTPKCDVYSFGILLIEATTGRRPVELKRPVEERVTLEWASKKFNEGKVTELVDPSMKEVVEAELLVKTFDLAIQCAAPVGADRPDMYSVAVQLQKLREDYLGSVKTPERVVSIL